MFVVVHKRDTLKTKIQQTNRHFICQKKTCLQKKISNKSRERRNVIILISGAQQNEVNIKCNFTIFLLLLWRKGKGFNHDMVTIKKYVSVVW